MRKHNYILVFVFLLFTCNGQGQTTNSMSKNEVSDSTSSVAFNGDYNDLLTVEMASRVTGFESSKANKMHTMKGMLAEKLMYYWENGREEVIEKSATNRKRTTHSRSDFAKLMWVDAEADMASFLDFIDLNTHPELSKVKGVGESAYWNSEKKHLEVYYRGVSFTLQVVISFDEALNKEKTIELANLIITKRIK